MTFSSESLEDALELLGELLTDRGEEVEVVAIGGGSLLLLGLIERATKDPSEGFAQQLELAVRAFGGESER